MQAYVDGLVYTFGRMSVEYMDTSGRAGCEPPADLLTLGEFLRKMGVSSEVLADAMYMGVSV